MMYSRRDLFAKMGLVGGALGVLGVKSTAQSQGPGSATGGIEEPGFVPYPPPGYERKAIPYAERKKITWPNGAKVAVHIAQFAEVGSGAGNTNPARAHFKANYSAIAETTEYNVQIGIWRTLELFEKHGMKATTMANGLGIKRLPQLHKEFHRLGHEISARSYDQDINLTLHRNPDEEREDIRKTTDIIAQVIGERPVGWLTSGAWYTDKTQQILMEEGYLWHGDPRDDDLPYTVKKNGKSLICLSHRSATCTDRTWFDPSRGRTHSPSQAFAHFQDTVDAYLETGSETGEALLMTWGVHPFLGSLPDRIRALDKMLAYMRSLGNAIWIARFRDIAEFWMKNYA